jgi:hypothetical protein
MYRILNNMTPAYLKELIPAERNIIYNLRTNNNLPEARCRLNILYESFVPGSIRKWNRLNVVIRESVTLNQFKSRLQKYAGHQTKTRLIQAYDNGQGRISVLQTRLRLGLSDLRSHLYDYNIIEQN